MAAPGASPESAPGAGWAARGRCPPLTRARLAVAAAEHEHEVGSDHGGGVPVPRRRRRAAACARLPAARAQAQRVHVGEHSSAAGAAEHDQRVGAVPDCAVAVARLRGGLRAREVRG